MIGHTQPRRIAARSVAERIAEELGTELGDAVGYQVRFTDQTSRDTPVKLMTDGILLAELQRDRELRRYDTIIIDEAHERSLNIDFLLGYLKQLLPRRPDLKLIITSATIDPERFARHFADRAATPAPIIEVSGRTYPVEVRYRPLVERPRGRRRGRDDRPRPDRGDRRRGRASCRPRAPATSWSSCPASARSATPPTRLATALDRGRTPRSLPLYARLSAAEQHRVFAPHTGRRDRARHQRRRDLADRARHPVRRRHRRRADLALLAAHQGAAAADRADQPGLGQPALRPLRPRRGRHLRSGSTPRRTSRPGRSSPTPRSCAPTSPRSSCR